jgi:Ring finger domain
MNRYPTVDNDGDDDGAAAIAMARSNLNGSNGNSRNESGSQYRYSTTPTTTTTTTTTAAAILPERYWLASMKDIRYVQQCSRLISQLFFHNNNINNNTPYDYRNTEVPPPPTPLVTDSIEWKKMMLRMEYISWVLYILLTTQTTTSSSSHTHAATVRPPLEPERHNSNSIPVTTTTTTTTTTPGMQICHLQYTRDTAGGSNNNTTATMTAMWHALLMATTLYGIRWFRCTIPPPSSLSSSSSSTNIIDVNQYTGQQRQNVFHLQRQEMIRRSSCTNRRNTTITTASPNDTTTTADDRKNRKCCDDVITNTTTPTIKATTNQCGVSHDNNYWSIPQRLLAVYPRTILVALDMALQSISTLHSYSTGGPHAIDTTTTTTDTTTHIPPLSHDDSHHDSSTPQQQQQRLARVLVWMYRLHMAYYCLPRRRGGVGHNDGDDDYYYYPTILHQLFRYRPQRIPPAHDGNGTNPPDTGSHYNNVVPSSTGRIIPVVGTLILLQLLYQFIFDGLSQSMVHYWVNNMVTPKLRTTTLCTNTNTNHNSRGCRRWWWVLLPRNPISKLHTPRNQFIRVGEQPTRRHGYSLQFKGKSPAPTNTTTPVIAVAGTTTTQEATLLPDTIGTSTTSATTTTPSVVGCYICQQKHILYPSCLIQCGHVFCWYCIQQWITQHDTKCPICRTMTTCQSNDVMLLYNF